MVSGDSTKLLHLIMKDWDLVAKKLKTEKLQLQHKKSIEKEVPESATRVDGRRKNFREKLMKLGYTKSQFK